ncbi:NADH dehydrogenase subunit 5 (mitochondrion) [Hyalella azteca]|uniref:NADH-ubiquinone oxidoreductase chain 5 n=1 Tax=Hyalella azteca TaxID=294128 RepID=A0A385UKU9_HYAAZ|nr:NADH dehydrogenase subunit 5 [Hyalella azteca]AYB71622.1 NADH dehydrogenase subunit 5 [Hyalella azteca]
MSLKTNSFMFFSTLNAVLAALGLSAASWFAYKGFTLIVDWEIVSMNSIYASMTIILDWMSLSFLSAVVLITSAISAYSLYYMKEDPNKSRFIMLLMLFVASMLCLIISPNLVSLLLGWDGLGLTSYALVIYYQNESACNAGMLTVLSNRIGDVCILLAIALFSYAGSWLFFSMDAVSLPFIGFFVGLAGMTKSAQVPFSAWLPAAMAAPTPVSALVHSSTLVTAGVYLLIRFHHLLKDTLILQLLLVAALLTTVMAGWGANFEVDLKKIVALSTLSQLGLMMMTLSVGMKTIAFFHMISHAMFKSTLFMAAGVMIHMSNGTQDSRFMSSLHHSSPLLMGAFSVMNMSLLGFPFLSGFYSKDLAMELTFYALPNIWLLALVLVAAGLTVAYSLRAMLLAMTSVSNTQSTASLHDSDNVVMVSTSAVLLMGLTSGYFFYWVFLWSPHAVILPSLMKYSVLVAMLMSGVLAPLMLKPHKVLGLTLVKSLIMMSGSSKMWFLPFLSTKYTTLATMKVSAASSELLDKGWLEMYPPQKGSSVFAELSQWTKKSQATLLVSAYLMTSLMALTFILLI